MARRKSSAVRRIACVLYTPFAGASPPEPSHTDASAWRSLHLRGRIHLARNRESVSRCHACRYDREVLLLWPGPRLGLIRSDGVLRAFPVDGLEYQRSECSPGRGSLAGG